MLRKIRITAAAVFFTVITLLLLDFTGTLHAWFGWMAKVQLLPAVLAVNAGVVAALVLLTLLFGRVYCSVICPLGVFQDVVSRAAARRRKNRFRYSRALSWLRYGILVLFLVALAAHFKPVSNLLAPYSAYGRIVSNLFAPLYLWGNNLLAYLAERAGSYAFYTVDVWVKGAATLAVAAVTFIVLAVLGAVDHPLPSAPLFRGDHACRLPQGYDVRRIVGRLCRAGRFCVRVRVAGGPDLPQADVTARRVPGITARPAGRPSCLRSDGDTTWESNLILSDYE